MGSHSHTHPHHHSPDERKARVHRLNKIAGQVAAIIRMVEADRDCPDILTQVVSVRKALKSFAQIVIHEHAEQCIAGAKNADEAHHKLHELLSVLERYVD